MRKSEASNSKRMKYYEAIQLVKLVMADEKEATQEADTVSCFFLGGINVLICDVSGGSSGCKQYYVDYQRK